MPKATTQNGPVVTVGQAALLCGKSTRWVQLRVAEGYIAKQGRGQYRLIDLVRGVIAFYDAMLEDAQKRSAAAAATAARTREIEQRIAIRERKLIPIEDAELVVSQIVAETVKEITGLPARLTRDRAERRRYDDEASQAIARVRDHLAKHAEALRSGDLDTELA